MYRVSLRAAQQTTGAAISARYPQPEPRPCLSTAPPVTVICLVRCAFHHRRATVLLMLLTRTMMMIMMMMLKQPPRVLFYPASRRRFSSLKDSYTRNGQILNPFGRPDLHGLSTVSPLFYSPDCQNLKKTDCGAKKQAPVNAAFRQHGWRASYYNPKVNDSSKNKRHLIFI